MLITVPELRLSYSGANTWTNCRMAWYWNYVENIRKKRVGKNLQIGAIVHDLMHRYYVGLDIPTDMEAYVQEKYPANVGPESLMIAREALTLFQGYLERHGNDGIEIISSEMKIELARVEPETQRAYTVYMIVDAVARDEQHRLWRFEHKTAAKMDSYYLNGLRGGLQGGIYHWGLNQTMPEPVVGTIYNMLIKTKIPQFPRMPVMMQSVLAERAVQTFDGIVRQIFLGDVYPNANACYAYNRECDYLPLCQQWKGEITPQIQRTIDAFYQEYRPTEKGGDPEELESTGE